MATRPGGDGGPVFGHGQLRLYLLAVLEEGPRSGYDVIRGLEDRFGGLYSPSAGTVYPRLAKLEDEGLVTRSDEGRRSTYALTEAGRAELDSRRDELAELEESLDASAQRLAEQMRERVRTGAADVRARLEEAARQARARARTSTPLWAATDAQAPDGGAGSPGSSGSAGSSGAGGAPGQGTHTGPTGGRGGAGPFVPPAFGSGFPFGQGGTPDWASVARWLSDVGITPPGGMSGAWRDWADMAGRAAGAAGRGGANTSDGAGAGGSPGDAPGRQRPSGVWADATDHVDPAFAGATDSDAGQADSETPGPVSDAGTSDSPQEPLPHETGTGWPVDVQAPGMPSDLPRDLPTDLHGDVGGGPGSADHPATGATGDGGSGRRGRSEWEEFLGGGIPDSGQLREIGEIIRDAATRIQDVLARSAPRREAGMSGASGSPGVWSDATDGPQWSAAEPPEETAEGTGSDR